MRSNGRQALEESAPAVPGWPRAAQARHGQGWFAQAQDESGRIQLWLKSDLLGDGYEVFRLDLADIAAVEVSSWTRTGECRSCGHAAPADQGLRPLPDKFHGLADVEQRYRQRYVDLIVSPESREVFVKRSRIIRAIRAWLVRVSSKLKHR
jgi:lysyl-tRNA synthetase class 2